MEKKQVYDILCGIFDYYTVTMIEHEYIFKKDGQVKQTIEHSDLLSSLILNRILYENHYDYYVLNKAELIKYLGRWFTYNIQMNLNFILEGMEVLVPVHREMLIDEVLD